MDDLKILSTPQLLELLRSDQEIKGLPTTNYRLSKILGINHNSVVHLLRNGGTMSDETAFRLAEELKLPFSYVLICMQYERTKSEEGKRAMMEVIEKYMKASAVLLALASLFLPFHGLLLAA